MIVIVVLGIIATLTIPALVNKNKESVAKTKVRKAMAAYESALNKMIIENDLKSHETLTAWAGANCANSTNYFKKVQGDGCIFKTSDGVWWNISDIERPVISFKEINAGNEEQITTNANNANDKTAFVLVGRFGSDGSLRVDDLGYETTGDNADQGSDTQVKKLYRFLGLYKDSNAGGEEVTNCDKDDAICKYKYSADMPLCENDIYTNCKRIYIYPNNSWCPDCTSFELSNEYGDHMINQIISTERDKNGNLYIVDEEESIEDNDKYDYRHTKWKLDSEGNVYKWYEVFTMESEGYMVCRTYYNPDGSIQSQEGVGCE